MMVGTSSGSAASAAFPRLLNLLFRAQNPDGGWGYGGDSSWTEPTAMALLAIIAQGERGTPFERGAEWLVKLQRTDGGWPPNGTVDESTWVTALAVIALAEAGWRAPLDSAVDWLMRQTGQETSLIHRLRRRLLESRPDTRGEHHGWPWFPGAAAWVTPTALTIVALRKVPRTPLVGNRIREGQLFLLSRICRDGGWNHGSSRALGYESDSYPETTGLALLALTGVTSSQLSRGADCGERHLRTCRSTEALCWLTLGLLAVGRSPENAPDLLLGESQTGRSSDAMRLSLCIATANAQSGRNVFSG